MPEDDVDVDIDAGEDSSQGDVSGMSDTKQQLADDRASKDSGDDISGAQILVDISPIQDENDLIACHLFTLPFDITNVTFLTCKEETSPTTVPQTAWKGFDSSTYDDQTRCPWFVTHDQENNSGVHSGV